MQTVLSDLKHRNTFKRLRWLFKEVLRQQYNFADYIHFKSEFNFLHSLKLVYKLFSNEKTSLWIIYFDGSLICLSNFYLIVISPTMFATSCISAFVLKMKITWHWNLILRIGIQCIVNVVLDWHLGGNNNCVSVPEIWKTNILMTEPGMLLFQSTRSGKLQDLWWNIYLHKECQIV